MLMNGLRHVRDLGFVALTGHRKSVTIEGIEMAFRDASPRMRYVMTRGYEKWDAWMAAKILTPEDVVLEAGAAIGFMAMYCLKVIGVRGVTMVEANPGLITAIRENFALNDLPKPSPIHAAVAGADGEISFGVNHNFWSSSVVQRENEKRITVPARTLPTLIAGMAIKPTALLMDIEGAEADIPVEHFASFRKIVIETHPKLMGAAPIDSLLAGLRELGFRDVDQTGGSYALAR